MDGLRAQHSVPRWEKHFLSLTMLFATAFVLMFHTGGETLSVGGIAVSNIFIFLFVLPSLISGNLFRRYPAMLIIPTLLLASIGILETFEGNVGALLMVGQGLLFLIFPYLAYKRGLESPLVLFIFGFVFLSQISLLVANGFSLPEGDLGGFFVSRRTVHSLMLGYMTLIVLPLIRHENWRVLLVMIVALLLVISQARGAAIFFVLSIAVFGSAIFSLKLRLLSMALSIGVLFLALYMSGDLVAHFRALLSLDGGSSSGYRAYLFELLFLQLDKFWLSGMPAMDIQYLLADNFTSGKYYTKFAIDNSFAYVGFNYGLLPLILLIMVAFRFLRSTKPFAIFLVSWFFLDDLLGSGLGWLLLGMTYVFIHKAKTSGRPRTENDEPIFHVKHQTIRPS